MYFDSLVLNGTNLQQKKFSRIVRIESRIMYLFYRQDDV